MRTLFLWIAIGAALILGFAVYHSYSSRSRLNVDPHAAREIEKAKRR
jgi:hypothetical protein